MLYLVLYTILRISRSFLHYAKKQETTSLEPIQEQPEVTVTYFQPDEKKNGGAYVTVTGSAKKIDKVLVLRDGTVIPIDDVISVQLD